jgi:uncharacterized repeat protein (TIGR01451 family)
MQIFKYYDYCSFLVISTVFLNVSSLANAQGTTNPQQPYCESIGGISNTTNLFTEADQGTFGNGTAKNQVSRLSPSSLTTYTYQPTYPPNDNNYLVSTHSDIKGFGTWHNPYGHTTGTPGDRFLVINANQGIIDTEMIQSSIISGLSPHTNYVFTAYILNLVGVNSNHIDPNVSFGIDLVGVDDDNDGAIDEQREIEVRFISGDIKEQLKQNLGGAEPIWEQFAYIFNTGSATSARFILRSNKLGGFGNDLAIDDLSLTGCNLPSGNLTGTLYYDNNGNDLFDPQEPEVSAASTIRLVDNRGTTNINDDMLVARTNSADGTYRFLNIPLSNNYQVLAPNSDGKGNSIGTINPRRGISVTSGSTTSNQDFGYDPPVSLLLLKRITAINPGQSDEIRFNRFVNDPNDANDDAANWPNNKNIYLPGEIEVKNIQPGDEVEYTIYWLSNGRKSAKDVKICDAVPDNMTFVKHSYGTEVGIVLASDQATLPVTPNQKLSNLIGDDRGNYYGVGTNPPAKLCRKIDPDNPARLVEVNSSNNSNGVIVVDLGDTIPPAITPGNPANSYGMIRFRTKIK